MTTIDHHEVEAALAHLRAVPAPPPSTWTPAQLGIVVRDIYDVVPLAVTASRPEVAHDADEVVTVVEALGKHLSRVHKRGDAVVPVLASECGVTPPPPRAVALAVCRGEADAATVAAYPDRLRPARDGWQPPVVIPPGWEPAALGGRDICRSVAGVVYELPSEEELIRFHTRHFGRRTPELTADHVHLLHWVLSRGLAPTLLELGPQQHHLVACFLLAETAVAAQREEALAALDTIASLDPLTVKPDDLADPLAAVQWAAPAPVARVAGFVEQVRRAPGNERVRRALASGLASFTRTARTLRTELAGTATLTDGQVLGLVRHTGLLVDDTELKTVTSLLREELAGLGLAADLDREIPEGVRAWRLGILEDFLDSRRARHAGEPDWAGSYERLVAERSALAHG